MMKLPLDAKVQLIDNVIKDFIGYVNGKGISNNITYRIVSSEDGGMVKQAARKAAYRSFGSLDNKFVKLAFDTRRIDQEKEVNPRSNCQYWHRSDPFISKEDEKKINIFAKMGKVLDKLRKKFINEPEWLNSYCRQLYDSVNRILRTKEKDLDIFSPQLNYLEQLIFARYRLTMDDLNNFSEEYLIERLLEKDEELVGRSKYLKETKSEEENVIIKDSNGNKTTQESIINAIFGGSNFRRDGEKTVERVITIKICDNVLD